MSSSQESSVEKMGAHHVELAETAPDKDAFDAAEEKALLRKIDLFLMPTIFLMYLLSYLDRTNIGNAKTAGMTNDLHMSSNQYSISLVVFFVSYVVFEVPSNMILARTRPSKYLPTLMVLWGIVTCCMALVQKYEHLVALRFIVGILESGFAPGVLLIISSWYKKSEQSKRFAVYISAAVLSGAFGGLLAGAISGGLNGAHGLAGWRWLFIIEGVATIVWAVIASFILLDFPATTKKFSIRERELAISRLASDDVSSRIEGEKPLTSIAALKQSVTNWRVWLLVVGYMVIVGCSTITYFIPTLVNGLGYTARKAQYMTVPIYLVAFVAVVCSGYLMDMAPTRRGLVIACWLSVSTLSAVVITTVYNLKVRYVFLIFLASGFWAANALALSYASSTFGAMPPQVRGISLAIVNAFGNLASIYGSYLFPAKDGPKYLMGFGVISALCAIGVATYLVGHVFFRRFPIRSQAMQVN